MCYEVSVGFQNVGRFENLVKTTGFMWQSTDDCLYCHRCLRQLKLQLTEGKAHGHQYVENLKTCDLPRLSSVLHLQVS
jgi:hypothetical protein